LNLHDTNRQAIEVMDAMGRSSFSGTVFKVVMGCFLMLSHFAGKAFVGEAGIQVDRIYTIGGRVIEGHVNWLIDDRVEYTPAYFPDKFGVIPKDSVEKIVYADGRVLNFSLRVFLENGDRVTGRLFDMDENWLSLKTAYGRLKIPRGDILKMESPVVPQDSLPRGLDTLAFSAAETTAVDSSRLGGQVKAVASISAADTTVETGLLTGYVYDFSDLNSHTRVDEGAEIFLFRNGGRVARTFSDRAGRFRFRVPPGTYRLVCRFSSGIGSKGASGIVVKPGATVRLDFVLSYIDLEYQKYQGKGLWTIGEEKDVATGEIKPLEIS